jgi:hypothetical protein
VRSSVLPFFRAYLFVSLAVVLKRVSMKNVISRCGSRFTGSQGPKGWEHVLLQNWFGLQAALENLNCGGSGAEETDSISKSELELESKW